MWIGEWASPLTSQGSPLTQVSFVKADDWHNTKLFGHMGLGLWASSDVAWPYSKSLGS